MIQIIPNWHPIFVHFTVALLLTAAALFLVARVSGQRAEALGVLTAARWCLWLGAALTVVTVITGFIAYNTVEHDELGHKAMTIHRNWALPTAALFVAAALWSLFARGRGVERGAPFLALVLVAAAGLSVTGWLGAENVYRYGLGVMSLPKAEDKGDTHEHGGEAAPHEHGNESGGDAAHNAHDHKHGDVAAPHGHGADDASAAPPGHSKHLAGTAPVPTRPSRGSKWVDPLRANGSEVLLHEVDDLVSLKGRPAVPAESRAHEEAPLAFTMLALSDLNLLWRRVQVEF